MQAFERAVATYEASLVRYARRIVGRDDLAQDIAQDTFIRLHKRWNDSFEPCARLQNWLYRVAHNCAVDYIRRETRRSFLQARHLAEQEVVTPPHVVARDPAAEAADRANAALSVLSLRERTLVVLKVYEQKSYREISEITGLSEGNVGFILHHAMRKMAQELKRLRAIGNE